MHPYDLPVVNRQRVPSGALQKQIPIGVSAFLHNRRDSNNETQQSGGLLGIVGWTAMHPYDLPVANRQRVPSGALQKQIPIGVSAFCIMRGTQTMS